MATGAIKLRKKTANLLATSPLITSSEWSDLNYDARSSSELLAVVHNGENPQTSTWLWSSTFPINISDISIGGTKTSNDAVADVRIALSLTRCSYRLLGTTSFTPYLSIYGIS